VAETRTRSTVLIDILGFPAKPGTDRIEPRHIASSCDNPNPATRRNQIHEEPAVAWTLFLVLRVFSSEECRVLPPMSCMGQNCDLCCIRMSDTLPFSEVKAHLSELADRVERQHDRILVTRNGRPSFVLLSPDDLESLEESLDILRDDELMESLRRSRSDAEQGKRLRLQDHV